MVPRSVRVCRGSPVGRRTVWCDLEGSCQIQQNNEYKMTHAGGGNPKIRNPKTNFIGFLLGRPNLLNLTLNLLLSSRNKLPPPVTLEACSMLCWEHGLLVAGVEDADECYCGTGAHLGLLDCFREETLSTPEQNMQRP